MESVQGGRQLFIYIARLQLNSNSNCNGEGECGIKKQLYQVDNRMKKSRGILRNKHQVFLLCKEAKRKKTSRFAKESLLGLDDVSAPPLTSNIRSPLVELQKMPTMSSLPPEWVDKYEECLEMIKSIDDIKKKILTEQSRRLSSVKLSDEKDAERKIYQHSTEATLKIKKCERLIEQIKVEGNNCQSKSDRQTCMNICMGLMLGIQEKTKSLRSQQRAFIEQRQNIQNSTKVSFLELAAEKVYDDDFMNDQEYENEELELELKIQKERNEEILKIVESIHELNDLYKELNNLVILQGSLLDRIDFNIEESADYVKRADVTLERVDERQKKSKCACRMIAVMVFAMIVMGIILIVKWRKK